MLAILCCAGLALGMTTLPTCHVLIITLMHHYIYKTKPLHYINMQCQGGLTPLICSFVPEQVVCQIKSPSLQSERLSTSTNTHFKQCGA